jgi:hypothetical protein
MGKILIFVFFFSSAAYAGELYQCKNADGEMSYQDKPCKGETVSKSNFKDNHTAQFTEAMIKTLAKMTGKSEEELKDPDKRQAIEVLAATDAAKSYAYTKVYGVSAKYCQGNVSKKLANYESRAADIINLGKYYYQNGIKANIKGKDHSKTGKELTGGLNKLVNKLDAEHKSASKPQLTKKCKEAAQALDMLTKLYSG